MFALCGEKDLMLCPRRSVNQEVVAIQKWDLEVTVIDVSMRWNPSSSGPGMAKTCTLTE